MDNLVQNLKLIGLTDRECQAYQFILKSKKTNYASLAEHLGISDVGAIKLVARLEEQGFVKKYAIGNKRIIHPTDITMLEKLIMKKKREELDNLDQMFDDLKSAYGEYAIKVHRIVSDNIMEVTKEMFDGESEIWEFIDMRATAGTGPSKLIHDKSMNTLYNSDSINLPYGKKIKLPSSGNFAHILANSKSILISNSTKENILIENEEVTRVFNWLINEVIKK